MQRKHASHRKYNRNERNKALLGLFDICDDVDKWHMVDEMPDPDDCGQVNLYPTKGQGGAGFVENDDGSMTFGELDITLDKDMRVVQADERGRAGQAGVTTFNNGAGHMLTLLCGGKVFDAVDFKRIYEQAIDGNLSAQFEKVRRVAFQPTARAKSTSPIVAMETEGAEHFDLCIRQLLGFQLSADLKCQYIRETRGESAEGFGGLGDYSPAHKAGMELGMVVRTIKWTTSEGKEVEEHVHNLDEFRTQMCEVYKAGTDGDDATVPSVEFLLTVTTQAEDAGERTARQFMELCGEEQWKGRSNAHIRCYACMQDTCSVVEAMFKEDEDAMMIDFKRIVSIFFTRKYRLALEEAGGPGDDQQDARTNRMSEVASKSALDTAHAVMGKTQRGAMPKQLATMTSARRDAPESTVGGTVQSHVNMRGRVREATTQELANQEYNIGLGSMDAYGTITLQLLAARKAEEDFMISQHRVKMLYAVAAQFVLSLVVFSVGAEQMPSNGGQFAAFLATTVAACVGIISAVLGFIGALGGGADVQPDDELKHGVDIPDLGDPNEDFLQRFLACNFWLLAILTTFLYSEIIALDTVSTECGATNPGGGGGAAAAPASPLPAVSSNAGCSENMTTHAVLLAMCGLMLFTVFLGCLFASGMLDSVNDKAKIDSKELMMTYFRVRFFEAKTFMQEHLPDYVAKNCCEMLDNDVIGDAEDQGGSPRSGASSRYSLNSRRTRSSIATSRRDSFQRRLSRQNIASAIIGRAQDEGVALRHDGAAE